MLTDLINKVPFSKDIRGMFKDIKRDVRDIKRDVKYEWRDLKRNVSKEVPEFSEETKESVRDFKHDVSEYVRNLSTKAKIGFGVATILMAGYFVQTARLDYALGDLENKYEEVAENETISEEQKTKQLDNYIADRNEFLKDNDAFRGLSMWLDNGYASTTPMPYNPVKLFKKLDKTAIEQYESKK